MTRLRLRAVGVVVAATAALVGCTTEEASPSSDSADDTVTMPGADQSSPMTTVAGDPEPSDPEPSDPEPSQPDGGQPLVVGTTIDGSPEPVNSVAPAEIPEDADELVLSDTFSGDDAPWGDDDGWNVEAPGEASALVVDGVGVMETDRRGTHEWVRAIADVGSIHEDASLLARIRPLRSDEGTVFIGLRGDGEWRDNYKYLPQVGVVLEYAYAPVFEGEVVLVIPDGPDVLRVGPVSGPVLVDGESAEIRFEVVGGRAQAKVWRTGEAEPSAWSIEADVEPGESGVVHLSYRDGVARSVAWEELTLYLWP